MPAGYLLISALLLLPPSGCGAPVDHLTEGADGGSAAVPVTANSFHSVGRAFLLKFGYLNDCPPGGQGAATRPTPTGYPLETTAKANPLETTTKDNLSTTSASSAVPQNLADLPELLGVAKKTSPELKAPPALADRNTAADCQSASDSSDLAAALLAFQAAYELPRTGLPDPPTLDAMNERRCGLADSTDALAREANRVPPSTSSRRHPRSVLHRQLPSADRFHRRTITWELAPFRESAQLPRELQRRLLAEAFRSWATVSPVYFREIPAPVEAADWSDRPPADISVSFERLQHGACRHAFDGPGNEVSHARAAGPIHIDADEDFRGTLQQQRRQSTGPSVDLRRVFIHEIGHTLGLLHSARPDSVMHPANLLRQGGPAPQIGAQERRLVQKNYGACSAKVNSVFDWIRTDPERGYPVFNTYFFACEFYWLFDNSAGRPRLGDPRPVGQGWPGVPDGPDAALELVDFDPAGKDNVYLLFFFFGGEFLEFDSAKTAAKPGYPKKIADNFGPKPGYPYSVPDRIDSAFYDYGTGLVHFFKGIWVFIYNPGSARRFKFNNCCESVRRIADRFPTAPGDKPLQTPVDSVYFRLADGGLYFFSGREVWQDVAYSAYRPPAAGVPAAGLLRYRGRASDKWPDLCFPEHSKCDLSEVKLED